MELRNVCFTKRGESGNLWYRCEVTSKQLNNLGDNVQIFEGKC